MPAVYSLDLRERVVAAVDARQGTQSQIATRFAVSLGWVEKLLRQRRRAGHIAPVGHRGGAPRRVDQTAVELIRATLTAQPDLALEELRLRLRRQARIKVSVSTLWRWVGALGLPRKKRRS
jgi:transposase